MTLTYPMLNRSRRILWLVTGADKVAMLPRLQAADPVDSGRPRAPGTRPRAGRPFRHGREVMTNDKAVQSTPTREPRASLLGWRSQARFLESLGASIAIRQDDEGRPFATDSGNMIFDCRFGPIADAPPLAADLGARAGIVEHGLFIGLADDPIVASPSGVQHRTRPCAAIVTVPGRPDA